VPNPSFEDTDTCNSGFQNVINWSQINSADYFNICFNAIPENPRGFQYASNGDAYAGFYTHGNGSVLPNYRELIGGQLTNPLTIGQKYFVSLKVSLANSSSPSSPQCATNKIGVLFTNVIYPDTNIAQPNTPFINNFAHIYSDSIITDTLDWVTIKGSFISDSVYNYIYIGNFFNDLHTDSILINGTACNSYYFVDDICVSIDSIQCNINSNVFEASTENKFEIYPNPFSDKIIFETIDYEIKIQNIKLTDLFGKDCFVTITKNIKQIEIKPTNELQNGIYILNILTDKYKYTNKLIGIGV
jgi:hypothetical protein